jgi:hypothetical protein
MNMKVKYSYRTIDFIFSKGLKIPFLNPLRYRIDKFGKLIDRFEYGNRTSEVGWEMDHIVPKSKNGTDYLYNMQPLQWRNNCYKSNWILD